MINSPGKKEWEDFVARYSDAGSFLQSWAWGEFQKTLGRKIFHLAVTEENEIKLAALVIKQPLKAGFNYFYSPRGPVGSTNDPQKLGRWVKELKIEIKNLAARENSVFWRIEPGWESRVVGQNFFSDKHFQPTREVQPRHTLILDISKPEEKLLAEMKQKTRYNIGLAERHKVQIKKVRPQSENSLQKLNTFDQLLNATAQRQGFRTYNFQYFETLWKNYSEKDTNAQLNLFLAEFEGKTIGGILVLHYGDTAVYLHGGMSLENREVMAPYLIQWTAIKDAKAVGKTRYDFWGASPAQENQTDKEKTWQGITRFKQGFSPETKITEYAGAYDQPYKPFWYKLYRRLKEAKK